MPFYVMTCDGVYPTAIIDEGPDFDDPPWFHGQRITRPVPDPLVYTLEVDDQANLRAMYSDTAYPLMSDELRGALEAAGVDNLQFFNAVIRDPATGREHTNYKAFNIVGLVAAADMAKSTLMGTSDSTLIDVDFDSLAIDEKRAGPFLFFRLAESVNAIIISDVVRAEIEARGIPGMVFYDPADWSG